MMKGFVIIAIVFIHLFILCGTESVGEATGDGSFPYYLQAIYAGLMIFFIASGYFFRPGRGYLRNILKRILPLGLAILLGILLLPLALFCWLSILGQNPDFSEYWYVLGRLLGSEAVFMSFDTWIYEPPTLDTTNGYYFLQIMLVAFVLFYAIADFCVRTPVRFCVSSALLVACTCFIIEVVDVRLPLYAELAPLATAFMLFGAYAGRRGFAERMERGWWMEKKGWALFALFFVLSAVTVVAFPPGNNFDSSQLGAYGGWSAFPFFVLGCSVSMFFLMVFALLSRVKLISKGLTLAGKHTLGILLGHIFGMKLIISLFYRLDSIKYMVPAISSMKIILFGIADIVLCISAIIFGLRLLAKLRRQFRINPNV